MHDQLTVQHALFVVDDAVLQEFQRIAAKVLVAEDVTKPLSLNSLDSYAGVFQVWLLFNEERFGLCYDVQKTMPFACNIYTLDLLRKDRILQQFRMRSPFAVSEKFAYILAYFIVYEMLIWVHQLLKDLQPVQQLIAKNMQRDYYLLAVEAQSMQDGTDIVYAEQKLVTHVLGHNVATTTDYRRHIDCAIQATIGYFSAK